jgi:amidase
VAGKPAELIDLGDDPSRRGPGRSYTGLYNSTGWPAGVVRAGTSPEGLPIGIQVVGRPWREDVVLAVCARLEEKRVAGSCRPHCEFAAKDRPKNKIT